MLPLVPDPRSPVPAYLQVRDRIVALVESGALQPGERLPPSRTLAIAAGLHRSTIVRAYEELRALGYLDSRPGGWTTVRRRARPVAGAAGMAGPAASDAGYAIDWDRASRPRAKALAGHPALEGDAQPCPPGSVDFARLAADPALAPHDELRRCLKAVLARNRGAALDYAHPAGWPPLREAIARRLLAHGVSAASDGIVVTAGAQQALDVVLRLLTAPGDHVVVESPTYGMAHALLRLHGIRPLEVPMRDDGLDLDRLGRLLARRGGRASNGRPRLLYTMPSFQNPTGITTGQAHRERLLALCEEHRLPLVEDGFEEEMKYLGRAVLPIKSLDARGSVLYVGTFSKVVFPGLRLGWIAAPPAAARRLVDLLHATSLATPTLAQAAVARFVAGGAYESYLRRAHGVYRRRLRALMQGLDEHLPPGCEWTRPEGGYTLWLKLPPGGGDEATQVERIARAGVRVAPGSRFCLRPPARPAVRLSVACVDDAMIAEGCRRLGCALRVASAPGRR